MSQAGLVALFAFVALCAVGLFGVHTSTVSSTSGGYTLSVQYPSVARAGLDVRLRMTVTHDGGFDKPVVLAVSADYFTIYEAQGWFPEASSMTRDGDLLYLTFDPPPSGDTFVADFDTYVQPSSQRGASARVELLDRPTDAEPLASVDFATRLVP